MFAKTALTVLAAIGFAATAHAAPASVGSSDPDTMTVRVSIADLNLSSTPGAEIALRRIHTAAALICGDEPDARDLGRFALYQSCVKSTVDRAVASLGAPGVTAMNGGKPVAMTVADRR